MLHETAMFTLRIIFERNAMILGACAALVLSTHHSPAQAAPYDAVARNSLAKEINQTYGNLVTPSLSVAQLFDIKNRLDKADSIAQNYGVDLDYREHTFIDLCDIESRIRLALSINQQYGKNINWREFGYPQLVEMEQQLKSETQTTKP
jgi:hypothetical protein